MKEEYNALMRNHMRDLVPCPKSRKVIDDKWFFNIKELLMDLWRNLNPD